MKGIVGGNAKDYSEVQFGKEGLVVVYHGGAHDGAGGLILSYILNR